MYKLGIAEALVIIAVSSSASPMSLNPDPQEPPGGLKDRIVRVTHSGFRLPPAPDSTPEDKVEQQFYVDSYLQRSIVKFHLRS